MDLTQVLLAIKIVLFAFIITSPFYNVGSVFSFLNNTLSKVVLLLCIVGASFVDLQLAIIFAIAFFVLLMNLNNQTMQTTKHVLTPAAPPSKVMYNFGDEHVLPIKSIHHDIPSHRDVPVVTKPSVPISPIPEAPIARYETQKLDIATPSDNMVMQNMYDFPKVECPIPPEATDAYMNDTIMNYYLDDRMKPYEEFIAQLTSEELLDSVSNGAYVDSSLKNSL